MTTIDFYFNASDKLQVACRLAAKACAQRKLLLVYAPDGDSARTIDRLMWTWQSTGFLPHCALGDAHATETPVLIAADAELPPKCEVLLNLAAANPPHFASFERVLEVVGLDDEDRQQARGRFRYYRDRGYRINDHDLTSKATRDG